MSSMNAPQYSPPPLDLEAIRKRLEDARGPEYWRSLEELAATPGFEEMLHREFPRQASEWIDDESGDGRRNFLKLMGASLALAGLGACTRQPPEFIMPYVRQPEEIVPGRPLFFATAMPLSSDAVGLLAESHEGRPTKVEGNPDHPSALGACDRYSQASVLGLYDPDRSQALALQGDIRSWASFVGALRGAMHDQAGKGGAGLRILTETVTSPTLADQIQMTLKALPAAKWHQWEPAGQHSARAGSVLAFGQPVNTYYDFSKADVIVSLDADFLAQGPGWLRYARQFAARRRVRGSDTAMNRLYVLEPMPTPTGTKADHRLPARAEEVEQFAWELAALLGVVQGQGPKSENPSFYNWLGPISKELKAHRGTSLIIAGHQQPPVVHALAHALNLALDNAGKTVFHTDPIEANPVEQLASLHDLVKDLDAGAVDLLLIVGGNPAFNAPVELGMRDRLKKARLRVHLGLYEDETSEVCQWHLPEAHYLETWGDTRALDGTVTIQQPLIAPLYGGKSPLELLAMLTDTPDRSAFDTIKIYWGRQHQGADFEAWWRAAVHNGVVPDTALPPKTPALQTGWKRRPPQPKEGLEIVFRPDYSVYDGRFANNGWLQELPRPITKITWDNPVIVSPATAHQLGLQSEGMIELKYQGRTVRAPVFIQPGHANRSLTVFLGYGRWRAGRAGTGIGFDVYGLRTAAALWNDWGAQARKVDGYHEIATTQMHHVLDTRRKLVASVEIEDYRKNPDVIKELTEERPTLSLYPEWSYPGYKWGMAIDLTSCTGCQACVVACVAENNIPVVGKDQVRRNREMHWLRVDSYYHGGLNNPAIYNQPVPCMHCENAPCELVCPVQATSHSSEGLNDMVYNRCVGTRYCSNNCPYKVRRFNFFLYQDWDTPSLKLGRNPDVTVRSRGVMEKCTYCVQRINEAKIDAEKEGRKVLDGEILTACQQACPTEAIIFGDLNDANSRVAKMKAEKLNYGILEELNTRPRTTYLAALRNPNGEIETG
jgi:MoCo/4Fe-4S cofactor protein with predicted Tat translocation signal